VVAEREALDLRVQLVADGQQVLQNPVLSGNVNPRDDSREDLVFVYREPGTGELVLRTQLSRADGGFDVITASQTDGPFVPDPAYPILSGDTSGDRAADVVLLYRRSCGLHIRTKESNGDGTWTTRTASCLADSPQIHQYPTRLGRLDGDARRDLVFVFRDPATGYLMTRVKRSNGDGSWTTLPDQSHTDGPGIHQYPHLLGDVNGDGFDDLVFLFRHWNGGKFSIRVKFSNGDGTFGPSVETQHPDGSQVPDPDFAPMLARVNGDACADLVLPHRPDSDGDYRIRTFLAVCDGSKNAQWQRTTVRLP